MLKIDNLSHGVLKDISFIVENNLTILGENGVGKTTLAKLITGLIKSEAIMIDGANLYNIPYKNRVKLINYIPSKLEIFDEYVSVEAYLGTSVEKDEVLKKLGILHLKNSLCKFLSSGESQLVMLADSLLQKSKYTIFDEPTSNLDPKKTQKVFSILKNSEDLQSRVVITHDLNLAYKLGFDILYLKDGKVYFSGKNTEFFSDENLRGFYDGSVVKRDDNIVVSI